MSKVYLQPKSVQFKIGDTVRRINHPNTADLNGKTYTIDVGTEWIVTRIENRSGGLQWLELKDFPFGAGSRSDNFELVRSVAKHKFKIGDWVIALKTTNCQKNFYTIGSGAYVKVDYIDVNGLLGFTVYPGGRLFDPENFTRQTSQAADAILIYLANHISGTVRHIATEMQLKVGSIGPMMVKLERKGLIKRKNQYRPNKQRIEWELVQ